MVYEKYLVAKEIKEVSIPLDNCEYCGKNGVNPECTDHGATCKDKVNLKIREVPWARRNQIMTRALYWDNDKNSHFDVDYYAKECLKAMIVEAPWGPTTDVFLTQIGPAFGEALNSLVPQPFEKMGTQSVDSLKKVQ